MRRHGEDRLGVHGHPRLRAGALEAAENLVVVHDDPVVDPDDRAVPHGVVVGGDRRVALGVVADVDEHLGRVLGNLNPLQEAAGSRPLLHDGRKALAGPPVGVPHGVGAALGDPGQKGLGSERPIHAGIRTEAVAGYSAHVL